MGLQWFVISHATVAICITPFRTEALFPQMLGWLSGGWAQLSTHSQGKCPQPEKAGLPISSLLLCHTHLLMSVRVHRGSIKAKPHCFSSGHFWRATPPPELPCGVSWDLYCDHTSASRFNSISSAFLLRSILVGAPSSCIISKSLLWRTWPKTT